ncbi:MAG: TonB family protein [Ahniella sp.]|nr:TonB family protein [Ahniella sp.]
MTAWAVEDLVVTTPPPPRRSWGVVLGAALSLVLHGMLVLFLMLPAETGPHASPQARPAPEVTWFDYSPAPPKAAPAPQTDPVAPKPPHAAIVTAPTDPIEPVPAPDVVTTEPAFAAPTAAEADPSAPTDSARSGHAPATTPDGASTEQAYVWNVLGHLQPFQSYPRAAQRRGHEGTVLVRARVSRRGVVLKAEIRKSSGHRSLDEAALALLKAASPLPPPPQGTTAITELDLPIVYALRQP